MTAPPWNELPAEIKAERDEEGWTKALWENDAHISWLSALREVAFLTIVNDCVEAQETIHAAYRVAVDSGLPLRKPVEEYYRLAGSAVFAAGKGQSSDADIARGQENECRRRATKKGWKFNRRSDVCYIRDERGTVIQSGSVREVYEWLVEVERQH